MRKTKTTLALIFAALVLFAGVGSFGYYFQQHGKTKASSNVQGANAVSSCTIDAKLVNSCRPWLGGISNNYGPTNWKSRILDLESRTGKQLDIVHAFNGIGANTVDSDEQFFANRANTILLLNWKPASDWPSAGGSNATVNANIDTMANSVKALGSKKIILALWHEPNNDVSGGSVDCPTNYAYANGADKGTPAQYRAMWQNVRNRFDTKGVTNVEWAIIYQSGSNWDCMQKELYPGNGLVDWVMWDHYYTTNETWAAGTSRFYNFLTNSTDATHDFTSKVWGIGEWGSWSSDQTKAKQLYVDAGNATKANAYPRIKAYVLYDSIGTNDSRIGYTGSGVVDSSEQQSYATNFAQNSVFVDDSVVNPPPVDTNQPTAEITAPAGNTTVSGIVAVNVNATDDVGVTKVEFSVDGTIFATDTTSPYSMSWDSKTVSNSAHTLRAKVSDAAGNSKTPLVNVTVNNAALPPLITSFSASPAIVTVGSATTLTWATANTVSCSATPAGPTDTTSTTWQTLAFISTGTKSYTLACRNSAGATTTATTSVVVNPAPMPPTSVSLTVSNTAVVAGTSVIFNWISNGSTSCTLNPGNFTASGASSSKALTLNATTSYTVTCSNNAGSTNSNAVTVTVTLVPPPPPPPSIASFVVVPTNVASGGTAKLSWQTSNVATNGCALVPSPLSSTNANSSWTTPALTASISYTLTCKNSVNIIASKSVSVTVADLPPPVDPNPTDPNNIPTTPTDPVVTAPNGQQIVSTQATGEVTQGELASLDTSTITDKTKTGNVLKIEFYDGEELFDTVTTEPFAFNAKKLSPGSHTITQRTYFDNGSTSEQSQIVEVKGAAVAGESAKRSNNDIVTGLISTLAVLALLTSAAWWLILRPRGINPIRLAGNITGELRTRVLTKSKPAPPTSPKWQEPQIVKPTDPPENKK